ncbi:MAG: acetate kinase [Planctomycetota bacterium]
MTMLILNCGSSSIKFQVRDQSGEELKCKGLIECIGEKTGAIKVSCGDKKVELNKVISDHTLALRELAKLLISPELGVMQSVNEIKAVGHRVVHGGEVYSDSVLIDDQAIHTIDKLSNLAPLHNPPNLKGILACRELLPDAPQVAVFDTAFHATLPEHAYIYPLPREFYEKHRIRRYGFHGTSHRYVSERARILAKLEDKPSKIITAHLGNGCSITAVKDGKSIETSMGFTPLCGLIMGTRPGLIDASIPHYLEDELGLSRKQVVEILQKKSGLLGISGGLSNDMRVLLDHYDSNRLAKLAVDMFCYRLKSFIGRYAAVLGGVDVLVFTGGIGENAAKVRDMSCANLEFLGIILDPTRNEKGSGKEALISDSKANVKVFVIPTNEELVIARETRRLTKE